MSVSHEDTLTAIGRSMWLIEPLLGGDGRCGAFSEADAREHYHNVRRLADDLAAARERIRDLEQELSVMTEEFCMTQGNFNANAHVRILRRALAA